jgi:hypothetical protein
VRDRWWALVNTIMKFRVPLKAGNFFTSWAGVRFSCLLCGLRSVRRKIPLLQRGTCPWRQAGPRRNAFYVVIDLKSQVCWMFVLRPPSSDWKNNPKVKQLF